MSEEHTVAELERELLKAQVRNEVLQEMVAGSGRLSMREQFAAGATLERWGDQLASDVADGAQEEQQRLADQAQGLLNRIDEVHGGGWQPEGGFDVPDFNRVPYLDYDPTPPVKETAPDAEPE